MEAGKVVRDRMTESEKLFNGKYRLTRLILPQNGKEIEKYERIPTETTYLIPLERVETSTAYNPRIHDPKYAGVSENILSETEPLHDNAFKAGASFFAQINADFGKLGKSIPPELETNQTDDEDRDTSSKVCHKEKIAKEKPSGTSKKEDEVMVIEDSDEETVNLVNSCNDSNSNDIQILQDDSHLPNMNSKDDSPPGKAIRRPSLNIFSGNSIKIIFDKSNQVRSGQQKETASQSAAERKQNKEFVDKTKKNQSEENAKDLSKIATVNDEIEKPSKKIETTAPANNGTKENALARLALDYDVDDRAANESKIDNQNPKEIINDNTENEKAQPGIKTNNSVSSEIKNTESRIIHSNIEELAMVVQNSQEKLTKTTENIIGQIISDAEIDCITRKTISENVIDENRDSETVARKTASENSEKEKEDGQHNEKNETSLRDTEVETNDEQISISLTTASNEIMTFHKCSEDAIKEVKTTKKSSKRVFKIVRKNGSRKLKSKSSKRIVSKTSEPSENTLRSLIEAEVETLMKTTLMKEIQKNLVNKLLLDRDIRNIQRKSPNQSQGSQSPNENSLGSTQGLFSPSLFPVEEVSTDLVNQSPSNNISPPVVQNRIPSRCAQDCSSCRSQQENISNSPSPLLSNTFSSQLNLGAIQQSATEGLFYSDIQLLKTSRITYDEVENFAKNFPPTESNPNKPSRKRKSDENGGGKVKRSKEKKQIENANRSRRSKIPESAVQLVGLEDTRLDYNLYANNQRTNAQQIIPDLNCQLSMPPINSPPNYDANTFAGHRNEIPVLNPNIRSGNGPNAVFHYYALPPVHSQNNPSSNVSPMLYPGQLPPPPTSLPPPSCVQTMTTSPNSRQQMQYEQISPPMTITPNVDLNYTNAYENRIFFQSPGDHQQYLARQQHSRLHVSVNQQLQHRTLQSYNNLPNTHQNTYPG